jgi:transposase
MDSHLFETWFETRLMCELPSDSIIVMDNAAFHRKRRLCLIAESYGHTIVFLLPYAPEYNSS